MATSERRSGPALKEHLIQECGRFSFYQAVQLLESLCPGKKPLGQALTPAEEAVRFSVKPSLVFPPSDICRIRQADDQSPVEMEVAFMGLIGPAGVLPHVYNELAIERLHQKDTTLTAFLDLFHHRLISLFYLAWKRHRFTATYRPGAKDRLSGYLLSLIGLGTPFLAERVGLPEESLIFCSGMLSRSIPCAAAIERTVEYLAGCDVRVEQFVEQLVSISPEDQTRLGIANSQLGVDTVCGSLVRDCQATFRLHLGPMGFRHFQRLLPSGDLLACTFALVQYMVGMEFEFEIRIFLKREEVPVCILGAEPPVAPRLGWTTWLKAPETDIRADPHITFHQSSG
jgi:type VI secretion system protein ImpH